MFANFLSCFESIFVYAADWTTLAGALKCIKAHWVVFILYWLYYCLNILNMFTKSRINAYMLLFVALAGLPVYALIWWYMLVPTLIYRLIGYLVDRQRPIGEDKIMGYLLLRAISRAGE